MKPNESQQHSTWIVWFVELCSQTLVSLAMPSPPSAVFVWDGRPSLNEILEHAAEEERQELESILQAGRLAPEPQWWTGRGVDTVMARHQYQHGGEDFDPTDYGPPVMFQFSEVGLHVTPRWTWATIVILVLSFSEPLL